MDSNWAAILQLNALCPDRPPRGLSRVKSITFRVGVVSRESSATPARSGF